MTKKRNVIKTVTSLLLALSVFISVSFIDTDSRLNAAVSFGGTVEMLSGSGINPANIKIDVYKSKLIKTASGYDKFTNSYFCSAYVNGDGFFSFERPSEYFVMCVDLSTLPRGSGITAQTVNIDADTDSFSFALGCISKTSVYTVDLENGDMTVSLFTDDGTRLYADYSVTAGAYNEASSLKSADGVSSLEYLTASVYVKANGFSEVKKYRHKLPSALTLKVQYLKSSGLISSKLAKSITKTIASAQSLPLPQYINPTEYHSDGDEFSLIYENGDYAEETLKSVSKTFRAVYALFVEANGFLPPLKMAGDAYYTIYMVTDSDCAIATTYYGEGGSSHIVASIPADFSPSDTNYAQTIAHEFFHAITSRYTRENNVSVSTWFKESLASWAGLEFVNRSDSLTDHFVKKFLADTSLSYHTASGYQCYGALLLPLTIRQSYGGFESIRQILIATSKLGGKRNIEYTAISNGLKATNANYSRSKAFVRCMVNNMFTGRFYSIDGSEGWADAKRLQTYEKSVGISELNIKPMSCVYFDFMPDASSEYLYITVSEADGKYSSLSLGCVNQMSGEKYSRFSGKVSSFYTYRFKNFSANASQKLTVGIINTSVSAKRTVNITAQYS